MREHLTYVASTTGSLRQQAERTQLTRKSLASFTTIVTMPLNDPNTNRLLNLIRDSFRVRKNHDPTYVDIGDNLARISAPQHQILFGRRGSGKSCLMVHYLNRAQKSGVLPVYILADEYKKLTYPDILIRLLIQIEEELLKSQSPVFQIFRRQSRLRRSLKALRQLLTAPMTADVVEDKKRASSESMGAEIEKSGVAKATLGHRAEDSFARTSTFKEQKLEALERELHDHKQAIDQFIVDSAEGRACLLLDDFYLLPRPWQPDIIDYLHRLLRDTHLYFKASTIRHRSTLSRNHPQTIGVELSQDVEELNLDKTLNDVEATQGYLSSMINLMGKKVDIPEVTQSHFNRDAIQALTLASGGVPRDFLNIFVHAVEAAVTAGVFNWLTPKWIWKGAGRLTYQTKLSHLREDADESTPGIERVFVDLLRFGLREKGKTTFLISQDEAQHYPEQHEVIQQLMDMKLIHVVEQDTSAASGRQGRYEAYTLDFSLFMEPRRRNIEISEFWVRGEDSHKKGVRESPVYPLERLQQAFSGSENVRPEEVIEQLIPEDANDLIEKPKQGVLFEM